MRLDASDGVAGTASAGGAAIGAGGDAGDGAQPRTIATAARVPATAVAKAAKE